MRAILLLALLMLTGCDNHYYGKPKDSNETDWHRCLNKPDHAHPHECRDPQW